MVSEWRLMMCFDEVRTEAPRLFNCFGSSGWPGYRGHLRGRAAAPSGFGAVSRLEGLYLYPMLYILLQMPVPWFAENRIKHEA